MLRYSGFAAFALSSLLLWGACQPQGDAAAAAAGPRGTTSTSQASLTGSAPQPRSAERGESVGSCGAEVEACSCGVPEVARAAEESNDGDDLAVGDSLVGRPRVTVAELLAEPDRYQGNWVRLEGDVSAMCHHRRAWFALQDEGEKSGQFVRVLTAPAFLVPPGCVGRRARTEGRVEVVDVPAAAAKHYAAGHQLGDPEGIRGVQRRVVLRASGAQFI